MVMEVEPPLSTCRIQWLDLQDCIPIQEREMRYKERFQQLLGALEERTALNHEGVQSKVRSCLKPLSYQGDFAQYLPRFVGRAWLFKKVDDWLSDTTTQASRVFWITGDPGSGKTAFASVLSTTRPQIAAYHICRYGDKQKSDPRWATLSIAWQLSTQIPELLDRYNSIVDLGEVCSSPDAHAIFEKLIVEPMNSRMVVPTRKPLVILLEGLDEATRDKRNSLAEFLAEEIDRLPDWVRFIFTSRPDQEVIKPLQAFYKPVSIKVDSEENQRDAEDFLRKELGKIDGDPSSLKKTIEVVVKQSGSLFLYVEAIRKGLEENDILLGDINSFPKGLGGIYLRFFRRRSPTPTCMTTCTIRFCQQLLHHLSRSQLKLWRKPFTGTRRRNATLSSNGVLSFLW